LLAPAALDFARTGQRLMSFIDDFPASVYAAISGYRIGGGLDLAPRLRFSVLRFQCNLRASWPGTGSNHRLGWHIEIARTRSRACATQMVVAAEKLGAAEAFEMGLVSEIAPDPLLLVIQKLNNRAAKQTALF